jgi:inhibitor of KinA sporulation pathway (predicted exonuclease)
MIDLEDLPPTPALELTDLCDANSIVVFDTEYTAWQGSLERGWSGPGELREIVQIGAVRLTPDAFEEADALDVIIRPVMNPGLSDYFTALTGITNDRVRTEGVTLAEALDRFLDFIADTTLVLANGSDLRVIDYNCRLLDISCVLTPERFRNLSSMLQTLFGGPEETVSSYRLAEAVGEPTTGRAHDGLADARSIAAALRALRRDGRI